MQCPSCGFHNMPGVEQCPVCSTSLGSRAAADTVFPPRRKDRPFLERIRWSISQSSVWYGARSRLAAARTASSRIPRPTRVGLPAWLGIRGMGAMLLSVIPGLGHIIVIGERQMGMRLLLGSLGAMVLGTLLIKTWLSDILFYAFVGASIYSVSMTVDRLWQRTASNEARLMSRLGIALMVISVYASSYLAVRLIVGSAFPIVNVNTDATNRYVASGDTILLRRTEVIRRGDFVCGTSTGSQVLVAGRVLAVPGDTVTVTDAILVNGVPTGISTGLITGPGGIGTVQLGARFYWVLPTFAVTPQTTAQLIADSGMVERTSLLGRGIAITSPPSHRQWLD